ncbi:cytochrome P450 (plasmid) [Gemmatirosa kalamazoonensis]|uniref:Cytochrome P450 n=1 Tax=Gemmatirosa kalamazoonensis TaxID=861299 RepID=W0RSU0_9BACT|nr:cytochrome P450 [Gemmatirosa kalamazoonensis]AHG93741.1 cytochrome P450 [Gemmatirosa kalamazoonensis]
MTSIAAEAPLLRGHWLFGNSRDAQRDLLGLYANAARLGDVVQLRAAISGIKWYAFYSPTAIERVLHGNGRNYVKPPIIVRTFTQLTGLSVFTLESDAWLARRRLLQPAFHRERLGALAGVMESATRDTIERWAAIARRGDEVDLADEMTRVTLRVASEALFGRDLSADLDATGDELRVALAHVGYRMNRLPVPLWIPSRRNRRFLRARRALDALCHAAIAERRRAIAADRIDGDGRGALLDLLLGARDAETGAALDDAAIRDEVMTALLAGHETTAAAMAWAWALLAEHAGAADRVTAEADAALGTEVPRVADLARLPYARRVVDETLRLYPPAWAQPRQAVSDDVVDGVRVPAGAVIALAYWVTHRRRDVWGDDADAFDPDRFLPERSAGRSRWAYAPFGGGQRQCIGQQFALMESHLLIAALGRRFRVTLVRAERPEPDATFTLRPRGGVRATLRDLAVEPPGAVSSAGAAPRRAPASR